MRLSPVQPGTLTLSVFGRRGGAAGPFRITSGRRARSPIHRRSTSALMRAPASSCSLRASRAATPNPTIAATFSVPARSCRSWGPPVSSERRRTPRRTQSAPTPPGPPSLCAESERRSTPSALTSSGSRPAACTASVWRRMPRPRSAAATSATGATAPTSPLARPSVTRRVAGAMAAITSRAATRPSASTGTMVSGRPSAASARAVSSTEACSTALVTSPAPGPAAASAPRSARLFASVAPLVKTISAGTPPTRLATSARAVSSPARARAPSRCALEGLAGGPRKSSSAAWTSGRSGAVALWSR